MSALRLLFCAAPLWLVACASLPTPAPLALHDSDDFALAGRIVVRQGGKAEVLRISWSHAGGEDRAHLETQLGQTIAEIALNPHGGTADLADGRHIEEDDDTELARRLIGIPLPLRRFADWVRAKPASREAGTTDKPLSSFEDSGWHLAYQAWGEAPGGAQLPALIDARQDSLSVRLRIEKWSLGAP